MTRLDRRTYARADRVVLGVWKAIGRPVLRAAGATYFAVALLASVVFSPAGMRAQDLVRALHHSFVLRCVLWAAWLLVTFPATHAIFHARGGLTLRALRLPPVPLAGALVSMAAVVHAPWAMLFGRGEGLASAAAALLSAVSVEAAGVAAVRGGVSAALGGALAGGLALADAPPQWTALAGAVTAPLAVHAAWRLAPEERATPWRIARPTHALFALYLVHVLRLARRARSRLAVGAAVAALGGAGLLTLRSDPTDRPLSRALAIMASPLVLVAATAVTPLLESERSMHAVLRSLRVRRSIVVAAFLLALATPATALAASAGLAASIACRLGPASLTGALAIWAACLACAVGAWGRHHERSRKRSAALFATGVVMIAIVAVAAVLAW